MYVDSNDDREFQEVPPRIDLRHEKRPDGSQLSLWAYLDSGGRLHVDGQDLGHVTRPVSNDGEYEYFKTIAARDIPRLVKLLGGVSHQSSPKSRQRPVRLYSRLR